MVTIDGCVVVDSLVVDVPAFDVDVAVVDGLYVGVEVDAKVDV